jgi:hypothetical protein
MPGGRLAPAPRFFDSFGSAARSYVSSVPASTGRVSSRPFVGALLRLVVEDVEPAREAEPS